MDQKIKDILKREFLPEDIAKDYDNNDYVKPHLVIARLNEAFGPDGWQYELMERVENIEYVIQFVKIGVKDETGEWVWKENCGGMRRTYKKKQPHEPQHEINQTTTYKGAVSNGLKRGAMMFGIGLHLYGDPEHEGVDPRQSVASSIEKGEKEVCDLLKCEPNELRNDHFPDGADNLDVMSLEELEGYLEFLRGLRDKEEHRDKEQQRTSPPRKEQPESGSGDTLADQEAQIYALERTILTATGGQLGELRKDHLSKKMFNAKDGAEMTKYQKALNGAAAALNEQEKASEQS